MIITNLYKTAKSLLLMATTKRSILFSEEGKRVPRIAKSLLALFLAALLVVGPLSPAFAQSPAQNPPSNPAPATSVATQSSSIAPVSSLGLAKYDFTNGPRAFP